MMRITDSTSRRRAQPRRWRGRGAIGAALLGLAIVAVIDVPAMAFPASGEVYWIASDSPTTWKAPDGRTIRGKLRVSVTKGSQAILAVPNNNNKVQQWRTIHKPGSAALYAFRNAYLDTCLTVARPEHSIAYVANCAPMDGQFWFLSGANILSYNYNHSIFGPRTPFNTNCLDITAFRNVPGTKLQRGRCHNMWNQQWQVQVVPANLR